MHQPALQRAINHMGSQAALAAFIGCKQQNVWFWLHKARKLPYDVAVKIEKATDGEVTARELRPDMEAS